MRYRLLTLVAMTAIAPPVIAIFWLYSEELWLLFTLFAVPFLFLLWYWILCRSQANSKLRGGPNYDPPSVTPPPDF